MLADIAVAAPYGGENRKGLVYIYNGRATGLNGMPSQVLEGQWASEAMPPSFGYALKGAIDVDKNGYPGDVSLVIMAYVQWIANLLAFMRCIFLSFLFPAHHLVPIHPPIFSRMFSAV